MTGFICIKPEVCYTVRVAKKSGVVAVRVNSKKGSSF